jgi:hypothetical protein
MHAQAHMRVYARFSLFKNWIIYLHGNGSNCVVLQASATSGIKCVCVAEFVVMKDGSETCSGVRYKLRMVGVPLGCLE